MLCFFKQKTAYEWRISDWSSDVCSSDLPSDRDRATERGRAARRHSAPEVGLEQGWLSGVRGGSSDAPGYWRRHGPAARLALRAAVSAHHARGRRDGSGGTAPRARGPCRSRPGSLAAPPVTGGPFVVEPRATST